MLPNTELIDQLLLGKNLSLAQAQRLFQVLFQKKIPLDLVYLLNIHFTSKLILNKFYLLYKIKLDTSLFLKSKPTKHNNHLDINLIQCSFRYFLNFHLYFMVNIFLFHLYKIYLSFRYIFHLHQNLQI